MHLQSVFTATPRSAPEEVTDRRTRNLAGPVTACHSGSSCPHSYGEAGEVSPVTATDGEATSKGKRSVSVRPSKSTSVTVLGNTSGGVWPRDPPGQLCTSWAVHPTSPCGPYAQRRSPEWPPGIRASYSQRSLRRPRDPDLPGARCRPPPAEVESTQAGLEGRVGGRHLPLDVCQTQSTPRALSLERGGSGRARAQPGHCRWQRRLHRRSHLALPPPRPGLSFATPTPPRR